jgi:hypothetical protein
MKVFLYFKIAVVFFYILRYLVAAESDAFFTTLVSLHSLLGAICRKLSFLSGMEVYLQVGCAEAVLS